MNLKDKIIVSAKMFNLVRKYVGIFNALLPVKNNECIHTDDKASWHEMRPRLDYIDTWQCRKCGFTVAARFKDSRFD